MDLIWEKFTEWLKELLVGGIMDNLTGLFDNVNAKVAEAAGHIGSTPQAWNANIYSMIRSLSDNLILPIAGVILAFVMTLELIQLIADRNNLHDIDTWVFFKWVFKTAAAVLIVSNTWNIVMGVFEAAQSVVNNASGLIVGNTSINLADHIADLEARLLEMNVWTLLGLWLQSFVVGFTMWALTICIFNAMLPLTKERAMELFMQDVPVFLLYGDSTEAMALDAEDISSHTGVFGVEREEWDAVRGVVTLSEQADTEKLFLENPQDAFLIYQIRRGGELDAYRFMNYDYLQSKGVMPERGGYDAIYTGGFMDYGNARTNLDMIYQRFNVDHPADFKGHSLSVSDIVALKQNGVVSCHYVDSIGFRELPNFLKPENYLKNAEMLLEDDYGMIDGIINNGPKQSTVADLEAQVKAGFSISLTELAAASHREQKKPSVLEKLRERTPEQSKNKTAPKRSAEREL